MLCETHLVLDGVAAPNVNEIGVVENTRIDEHVARRRADAIELGVERTVVKANRLHGARHAERVTETLGHEGLKAVRRRNARAQVPHDQRFGTVLVAQLDHLGANLVKSLIPADLFPLAFATLANTLERLFQALGIVGLTA